MSVRITDNTPEVKGSFTQKANIFLREIAEEIVKTATPNTPKKTGRLRADVVKQVLGLKGKIIWGKNYAVFQEKKQFASYTTPGTGPFYAENAVRQTVAKTGVVAKKVGLA